MPTSPGPVQPAGADSRRAGLSVQWVGGTGHVRARDGLGRVTGEGVGRGCADAEDRVARANSLSSDLTGQPTRDRLR